MVPEDDTPASPPTPKKKRDAPSKCPPKKDQSAGSSGQKTQRPWGFSGRSQPQMFWPKKKWISLQFMAESHTN